MIGAKDESEALREAARSIDSPPDRAHLQVWEASENSYAPVQRCTCCDGHERLQESHGAGGLNDVCLPCFHLWYDGVGPCNRPECKDSKPHVHGEDIGAASRKAKAEGRWPWKREGTAPVPCTTNTPGEGKEAPKPHEGGPT